MIHFITNTPMNRVFFAINHYVSAGDHIGEGIAMPVDDNKIRFLIPVNPNLPLDVEDWNKFNSKLQEITFPAFKLENHGKTPPHFIMHTILVAEKDLTAFADALMEKPGKMGWGSPKTLIDRFVWDLS
jgi:hypothetical protein